MLEHLPQWIGALMRNVRAGHAKLAIVQPELAIGGTPMNLSSPAFADGARLPERFTADGAGISPPLVWNDVPAGTQSLVLIVEDPDAPAPNPIVHAIVWGLPADERRLAEGAIVSHGKLDGAGDTGRNSAFGEGWLPPDPPSGHGSHDYIFQLFALSGVPAITGHPGRSALLKAMTGKVLAAGLLVGTYSRGEAARPGSAAREVSPTAR